MLTKRYTLGSFLLIDISDEFTVLADLNELDIFIDGLITQGNKYLAVRFENISYIYSGALAVLLKNVRKMTTAGGELVLLEPHPEIDDVIRITNIDKLLKVFHSEDELIAYTKRTSV